jgi:hypothetical protein
MLQAVSPLARLDFTLGNAGIEVHNITVTKAARLRPSYQTITIFYTEKEQIFYRPYKI